MVRTAALLNCHHGSSTPSKVLRSLVGHPVLSTMTSWTCRFCNLRLQVNVSHCSQCSRHWKQAQMTSRSKSRSARAKDNNRSKQLTQKPNSISGAQEEVETGEKEELFLGNHPWVTSSPHARVKALGPTEQPQVPRWKKQLQLDPVWRGQLQRPIKTIRKCSHNSGASTRRWEA